MLLNVERIDCELRAGRIPVKRLTGELDPNMIGGLYLTATPTRRLNEVLDRRPPMPSSRTMNIRFPSVA